MAVRQEKKGWQSAECELSLRVQHWYASVSKVKQSFTSTDEPFKQSFIEKFTTSKNVFLRGKNKVIYKRCIFQTSSQRRCRYFLYQLSPCYCCLQKIQIRWYSCEYLNKNVKNGKTVRYENVSKNESIQIIFTRYPSFRFTSCIGSVLAPGSPDTLRRNCVNLSLIQRTHEHVMSGFFGFNGLSVPHLTGLQ